ncbi:MAG: IclR family pca regulon transcriptional regulator [Marivirga sp.]|jgi:IclR family pca regulon transcriptional regulator
MAFEIKKSDYIQSLEKGLKVISAFDAEYPEMTLTEVAKKVDLTRANARRILLTLQSLGYVQCPDGKLFYLSAKVLGLGYSFLSGLPVQSIAEGYMKELTKELNESCSMAVLDDMHMVYVARIQTKRIMTISLGIGTRLPLHATSMGKVLLAGLGEKQADALIEKLDLTQYTEFSITETDKLKERIALVRKRGWSISDQELEIGVRSIASPIKDKNGQTIAALNISGHTSRVSRDEMQEKYLPALNSTVARIEAALHKL